MINLHSQKTEQNSVNNFTISARLILAYENTKLCDTLLVQFSILDQNNSRIITIIKNKSHI